MPVNITPNMGLIAPVVGQEPGPNWASDLNASLGILDQHNHSSGQGVQITPTGININANLPMNSNNLTTTKTITFTAQSGALPGSSPYLGCIYVAGNELYYNDESGNIVPITLNGSVNAGAGSITGLPSGTASASYSGVAQTFIWQSATNTPANMDNGSVTIRPIAVSPNGVTINAPAGLGASYGVTLPTALPSSTSALSVDPSGTMSFSAGGIVPTGSIIMTGSVSAPSGFLLCDGSSYLITSYPNLAAALYDSSTSSYAYGSIDASHFNVPDFRGIFPRGTDSGAGNDPDSSSRTAANTGGNTGDNVGSTQTSAIQNHTHYRNSASSNEFPLLPGGSLGYTSGSTQAPTISTTGQMASGTTSTETRPINTYVNFIIKT
jgi:microcystin-dependent protein